MSRRRRAVLLLGLALLLGGLAAGEVGRREAALRRAVGPLQDVVVARVAVPAGRRLGARALAVRRLPARWAPPGVAAVPTDLVGLRTAVDLEPGTPVTAALLRLPEDEEAPGAPVRPGERVADVVAAAPDGLVTAGARVDVLVTREPHRGHPGGTVLALEDVEVLAAAPVDGGTEGGGSGGPRVRASLRVTVRQAVFLAAAQAYARELRLLPRAPGDEERGEAGLEVDAGLSAG